MKYLLVLVIALAPAAAQDLLKQGADAMRENRFADAERIYRGLLESTPGDPRLRLNLALALYSARKYREALPEIDRYLKARPEPGPPYVIAGFTRLKLNDACGAIAPLETAAKWKSTPETLAALADSYSGCNRPAQAAKVYAQLARLDPAQTSYTRAAARAYWQARQYAEARPLYASLESTLKSDPGFLYEYGDVLARLEGAESGLPYLESAVRLDPSSLPARGALGRTLLELDRASAAIPHLEAAAPADPTLLMPLSRAYKAAGRASDAARVEAEYRKRVGNQN